MANKKIKVKKLTLRQARRLAELTQGEVAKELGVSLYTVLNWEKGKTFPNAKMIEKIAKLYGLPEDMIEFCNVSEEDK